MKPDRNLIALFASTALPAFKGYFLEKRHKMFEDLIPETPDDAIKEILYICPKAKECNAEYCLHKEPHGKTELGRPYQPNHEEPGDCSILECKYFLGKVVCVPA